MSTYPINDFKQMSHDQFRAMEMTVGMPVVGGPQHGFVFSSDGRCMCVSSPCVNGVTYSKEDVSNIQLNTYLYDRHIVRWKLGSLYMEGMVWAYSELPKESINGMCVGLLIGLGLTQRTYGE